MPDFIERILDIADQHQHGIEHEKQTDTQENTGFGVHQIAVDKADDDLSSLGLRLEGLTEPYLNETTVAKATGNGKDHRHDGHNGQQRRVSQCRRLLQHALGSEEADGQHHLLQHFQPQEPKGRNITLGDSPQVLLEEIDDMLNTN